MLAGNINHGSGFDIDGLGIALILDLRTGLQLSSGKYMELFKQIHCLFCYQRRNRIYHGLDIWKTAALCFCYPFL